MKQLRQLCATFVLVLVFTTTAAFADGIIHGDKTTPPPPPSSTGIIHGDRALTDEGLESEETTVDLAMEFTLNLI